MISKHQILRVALAALAFAALDSHLATTLAQGPAFTYQGRIQESGTNFSGVGQFKFALITSTNANRTATATANLTGQFVTSYTVTDGGAVMPIRTALPFTATMVKRMFAPITISSPIRRARTSMAIPP